MNKVVIVSAALVALSSPVALPAQTAPAQPVLSMNVEALTAQPGTWSYRSYAGGSEAAFADSAGVRRLAVRCNRVARTVSLARTGVPAATATLSIWTASTSRAVPARFETSQVLTADIQAMDPLLDAVALSRGKFATSATGAPLAVYPSHAEVARVIEDCRT